MNLILLVTKVNRRGRRAHLYRFVINFFCLSTKARAERARLYIQIFFAWRGTAIYLVWSSRRQSPHGLVRLIYTKGEAKTHTF